MQSENRGTIRGPKPGLIFANRPSRRVIDRIGERAVNRAAQLLGPMLVLADGTLRSLRRVDYRYGED